MYFFLNLFIFFIFLKKILIKNKKYIFIGSLPTYALDAVLITTNSKLANLLYQMQITGYMFKNAEYRFVC
jgi:hypothetical protein